MTLTFDDIKAEVEAASGGFGFGVQALCDFLSFSEADALGLLKPPAEREPDAEPKWNADVKPRTADGIVSAIREYMLEYGFDKALNHRGLSAGRTIDKMRALIRLLSRLPGNDHAELLAFLEQDRNYRNYGVPMLKRISAAFNIPIPPEIERWQDGEPCRPDCDEGCG